MDEKPQESAPAPENKTEQPSADVDSSRKAKKTAGTTDHDLGVLNDVSIYVSIEIGRAQMKIRDLLNLTKGSVIELDKAAGDPVDIYANGKLISTGTIITANGKYCAKITSMPEKIRLGENSNDE